MSSRYNLEAFDVIQTFDPAGALRDTTNVSIDDAHRIDTGVYIQTKSALGRRACVSGGVRRDQVTTQNIGGFFGNRTTSDAPRDRGLER